MSNVRHPSGFNRLEVDPKPQNDQVVPIDRALRRDLKREVSAGVSVSPEAARAQLERIVASEPFRNAERVSRFLRFVVEYSITGRAGEIKEFAIASEVYRADASYDPRSDSLVRVEGRRLRSKLREYYASQGASDPVVISIPKGSYRPLIEMLVPSSPGFISTPQPIALPVAVPPVAHRRVKWFSRNAIAVLAAVLIGGLGIYLILPSPDRPAIAVLPFADYSPAGSEQYRADGVSEDITQALAHSPNLRVMARTSTSSFRGHTADVREIGRRLGVGMIVEGSVQRLGERYRIAVRLVNAKDGFDIWSSTQETDGSGLELAERTIVSDLLRQLKVEAPYAGPSHTPPAEAQDLLLRARYLAGQGGPENRSRALEQYERAIALDPEYPRAWGELARLLSLAAFHDYEAAPRLAPRIRSAAQRAIQLGDTSADPHLALARLAWFIDWNWAAAEPAYRRALEINPNYAAARLSFALALASHRQPAEAVTQARRAVELDPLSYGTTNDLGVIFCLSRRFEEAAAHARRSLSLAPKSDFPHFLLGYVLSAQGQYQSAAEELEKATAKLGRAPEILGILGYAYARAGRTGDATKVLQEMESNPDSGDIYLAILQTGLGHSREALDLLDKSAARRETDFLFVAANPLFDPLRDQPRFAALCGKLGLTPR